jgi:hypothetical protein
VVIVGGGAAGCEVAANLAGWCADAGLGVEITVVEAAPDLLPASPKAARRIMRGRLGELGVGVVLGRRAVAVDGGAVLEDGGEIRADLTLAATGVAPPEVFGRSGLATGDDGALWVDRHLRSPNDPGSSAAGTRWPSAGSASPNSGSTPSARARPLPQPPGRPARGAALLLRPQGRYLYVLDLGDGTGLAIYGPLANRSRPALRLKHLIDRRFVRTG